MGQKQNVFRTRILRRNTFQLGNGTPVPKPSHLGSSAHAITRQKFHPRLSENPPVAVNCEIAVNCAHFVPPPLASLLSVQVHFVKSAIAAHGCTRLHTAATRLHTVSHGLTRVRPGSDIYISFPWSIVKSVLKQIPRSVAFGALLCVPRLCAKNFRRLCPTFRTGSFRKVSVTTESNGSQTRQLIDPQLSVNRRSILADFAPICAV